MTFASTYITFLNAAIWCQNHHLSFLPVSAFKYWLSASMPSSRYDPMRSQNIRKNHADRPGPFQQIKLKFLKLGARSTCLIYFRIPCPQAFNLIYLSTNKFYDYLKFEIWLHIRSPKPQG